MISLGKKLEMLIKVDRGKACKREMMIILKVILKKFGFSNQ